MGTDYAAFLAEAHRLLAPQGQLWIAEVRSRFVPEGSKEEDFQPFIRALRQLGFSLVKQDAKNRMFVVWLLSKKAPKEADWRKIAWPQLKACMYKRR